MKRFLTIAAAALIAASASGQNFVHLYRYSDANASIGAPAKGEKRVVLVGDSITEGWVEKHARFFSDGRFIGRGISGEVSAQMLLRFRSDVIDLHPKTVAILAGCNDIALNQGDYNEDYTFGNIVSMVELAKAHKIKVILCSLLPAGAFPWRPEVKDSAEKVASLNKRLEAYAKANHIKYVDYWTPMVASDGRSLDPAYSKDGIHPIAEGYEVMEKLLLEAL